jgi:hypothetical protein
MLTNQIAAGTTNQTQKALLHNYNQKVNYKFLHIMYKRRKKRKKRKKTNAQEPETNSRWRINPSLSYTKIFLTDLHPIA